MGPPRPGRAPLLADALLAEAVREGWLSAPLLVAEAPPPRQPVATWEERLVGAARTLGIPIAAL